MSYSFSYLNFFIILTVSISGTGGLLKFHKKQLSNKEENEKNLKESEDKIETINIQKIPNELSKKRSNKKNKNKKRKEEGKCDDDYNPDNEDSSEFSSIRFKKTKEITKTTDSDINSINYEFKISNPINFEIGVGGNSYNDESNNKHLMRFSSDKNFKKRNFDINLIEENINSKHNLEEEYCEDDREKGIRIKNTKEMNKMLNLQKNKIKDRLSNINNLNDSEESMKENKKHSKFLSCSIKKLEFSRMTIDSDTSLDNLIEEASNNASKNIFIESSNTGNLLSSENLKFQKDILYPKYYFEQDLKLYSNVDYSKKIIQESLDFKLKKQNENFKNLSKNNIFIELPFNSKNSKSFCSKVVKEILSSSSDPDFIRSYLKPNNQTFVGIKDLYEDSKFLKPPINSKKSDHIQELMKANESTCVLHNTSYMSTDRNNLNIQNENKNTDRSNNTTFLLINNFKEGKEFNQINDIFASQSIINNKTDLINSFDLEYNNEQNLSYDLINLCDIEESENKKVNDEKLNDIFDMKNDVSQINHDNENICYITRNVSFKRMGELFPMSDRYRSQTDCKIIDNIEELDIYLKKFIELNSNNHDNINRIGNDTSFLTVRTLKLEIDNFDEKKSNNYGKKKIFEILDPNQFNIIIKYMHKEMNEKTIDLSERYKNLRRKFFDENLTNKDQYIFLIKEFILKRSIILNEIWKQFITMLNITKKLFFETSIFFILKNNNMIQSHCKEKKVYEKNSNIDVYYTDNNDCLIDSIFKSKKYNRYVTLFENNNLYDRIVIDNIDEITDNLSRLNYVGIKEVIAPRILNFERMMKILTFQNRKIKELSKNFSFLSKSALEIILSDFTYSEYGIDNEAIISAYKKIKQKNYHFEKMHSLNMKLRNIKYYKILFINDNIS